MPNNPYPFNGQTRGGQVLDPRDEAVIRNNFSEEEVLSFLGNLDKTDAQKNMVSSALAWRQSEESASNQRAREEEMSNTSYQRAVNDLEKAGLNAALAYQQGGASTPSGAAGSAHAATTSRDGTGFSRLASGMLTTALAAAGGVAGKAIGAKIANSAASEKVANSLENNMTQLTKDDRPAMKYEDWKKSFKVSDDPIWDKLKEFE